MPLPEMLMQVAPGNVRLCNPENPVQDKAVILWTPTAARTALNHEWLKTGPFSSLIKPRIKLASLGA